MLRVSLRAPCSNTFNKITHYRKACRWRNWKLPIIRTLLKRDSRPRLLLIPYQTHHPRKLHGEQGKRFLLLSRWRPSLLLIKKRCKIIAAALQSHKSAQLPALKQCLKLEVLTSYRSQYLNTRKTKSQAKSIGRSHPVKSVPYQSTRGMFQRNNLNHVYKSQHVNNNNKIRPHILLEPIAIH